jgi:hypothetical protein
MNTATTEPTQTGARLEISVDEASLLAQALTEWNTKATLMTHHNITRYGSFDDCTKRYEQNQLRGMSHFRMFAIDRPTSFHGNLQYTKEYCLGGYSSFFTIMQTLYHGFNEVLHPTCTCRLFMETKLEKVKWMSANDNVCFLQGVRGVSYIDVLDKAMEAAVKNHEPYRSITQPQSNLRRQLLNREVPKRQRVGVPATEEWLRLIRRGLCRRLAQEYIPASRCEWTEEVCQKGRDILVAHVKETIVALFEGVSDVEVSFLSRSSEESFEMRIICPGLCCDSPCSSMPLVVHEISRQFAMANLRWLFDYLKKMAPSEHEDVEYMFRLRALRMEAMASPAYVRIIYDNKKQSVHNVEGMAQDDTPPVEGCEKMYFHGVNDTPFDESVYDLGNTIPAPTPRLVAKAEASGLMINSGNTGVAPPTKARWISFLLVGNRDIEEEEPIMVRNMRPSAAYAREGYWKAIQQTLRQASAAANDVGGYMVASLQESSVYVEERPRVSMQQRRADGLLLRHDFVSEYHPVGAYSGVVDDSTLSETTEVTMENGQPKLFGDCKRGELLFCCNPRRPSGCVFQGGYWCAECGKSTIVPGMSPWEEPYVFLPDEIVCETSAEKYMPNIEWDTLLARKYVVIAAPMGSGKTQQVCKLLNTLDGRHGPLNYSVIVISFRILLSIQQAKRFGIHCYTDLNTTDLKQNPKQLTICVNSLGKLGDNAQYDYVILDECGLIRRHFLGRTMGSRAEELYGRLKDLQKGAKNVIMLQDGITRNDIQFYTEAEGIECDNRIMVSGHCFLKPIKIHPLSYTNDHLVALGNLVVCYKKAFEPESAELELDNGSRFAKCLHPFMVFCSNVGMARTILAILRKAAEEIGADPDRIQGVWAAIKIVSPFAQDFAEDPNETGKRCDVVICSSVIGAGFSVEKHFQSFHAFLYTGVLNLDEEKQLIQRLRYQVKSLSPNAIRNSYIYVQLAYGKPYDYRRVLWAFNNQRMKMVTECHRRMRTRLIPDFEECRVLAETQARLGTERAATRAMHDTLWLEYGSTLASSFELLAIENETMVVADAARRLQMARQRRKKDIVAYFQRKDRLEREGEADHVDEYIEELEMGNSMDIVIQADEKTASRSIEDAFGKFQQVAMDLVAESNPDKAIMLRSGKGIASFVSRTASMITWLMWAYGDLIPDIQAPYFARISMGPYKATFLKNASHFIVGTAVLKELFGVHETERPPYQRKAGRTPFYVGAEVVIDQMAVNSLWALFHVDVGDTLEEREEKQALKNALAVFKGGHDRHDSIVRDTFANEKTTRNFVKGLLNRMGLDIKKGNNAKRVTDSNGVKRSTLTVASFEGPFIYALCLKNRHSLLSLLPTLMDNVHTLDEDDMSSVQRCIDKFKEKCNARNVDHGLLDVIPRRGAFLRHLATPATLEERRVTEAHARDNEAAFLPNSQDVDYGSEQEAELANERAAAETLIQLEGTRQHDRDIQVLRQMEVPSDEDDWEDDYDRENSGGHSRYIDYEAIRET